MADKRTVAARLRNVRVVVGDRAAIGAGVAIPAAFRENPLRWPPAMDAAGTDATATDAAATDASRVAAAGAATAGIDALTDVEWLHLVCQSTGWLGRFAATAGFTARRVTIVVDSWRKPLPDWSGRVGAVPRLVRHEVRLPNGNSGRAVVDLTLGEPLPVARIVAAGLAALVPRRPVPSVLSADPATGERVPRPRMPSDMDTAPAVLVDTSVVNPIGRAAVDHRRVARLRFEVGGGARRWRLEPAAERPGQIRSGRPEPVASRGPAVAGRPEPVAVGRLDQLPLDDGQLAAIRSIGVIGYEPGRADDPVAEAALLVQLAATGVVLHAEQLPWMIEELLSAELSKVIRSPLPEPFSDPIEWEFRSVWQRRAALRNHAAGLRQTSVTSTDRSVSRLPAVSALLVTMRPDDLPKAIEAMAAQTYPELEIVVGLHGCSLAPEIGRAVAACGRPVEILDLPRSMTLGEALGEVTARARGDLVTKVDDDDVYGPEHIWDLVIAREFSGAALVGKGAEFVYLEALGVTARRSSMDSEKYSTVVAGGTILISRGDLEQVGGWRPAPHSVDRALFERVQGSGGLIYRTHPLGFVYRRHSKGHTWDPGLEYFLRNSGPQWSGLPPFAEFVGGGR